MLGAAAARETLDLTTPSDQGAKTKIGLSLRPNGAGSCRALSPEFADVSEGNKEHRMKTIANSALVLCVSVCT